ncbi:glycoside hydrolase family 26 protein [Megamonas funiformis]|uniref:glycoside hydrolase family 26 protein n=1 Tax=Megamonas funiformis TaxID=437897 RepID=UPI003563F83D
MNKKILTSLILSACISCSFATNTTFANEQISEENAIVATANQNIPDYMVKITKHPIVKDNFVYDKSIVKNTVVADKNATEKTKELAAYLKAVAQQDKVIVGHQSDTSSHVRADLPSDGSDIKDMTGSLAAITGVDTLAISGDGHFEKPEDAMKHFIDLSIDAANQGALITVSTHVPNFCSDNIKKLPNGKYDFTKCNFWDCSNFYGDAKDILPGGQYNDRYLAYIDMIAEYCLALQDKNIPILFRPFHEATGSWFWWGGNNMTPYNYKRIYRYMVDQLQERGVHNLLYVYAPGTVKNEKEYLERYPGDDYVDVVAFDTYDVYYESPAYYRNDFFDMLDKNCQIVSKVGKDHNKISALAEVGCGVLKPDGSDSAGILKENNPILNREWYKQVAQVVIKNDMSYFLLWSNDRDTSCFVPYKYNDEYGHELTDEFIDFYNWDKTIFANQNNFY